MRQPHVLLTSDEVEAAVTDLKSEPVVVIDVETTKARPRSNELRWVGLGAHGRNYLIPTKHPKGIMLKPERREKMAACLLYPNDERGLTKAGKPSFAMKEYLAPAVFAAPPEQLMPHEVCEIIRPLLWSDTALLGHNVKFDLMSLAKYYKHEIPPGPYHDTIIMRHVIQEDLESYSLKDLTCEWFRIGVRADGWVDHKLRQRWYPNLGDKGTDNFGLDVVARYLAKDVRYCWLMYQAFRKTMERKGVREGYEFEMSVYPIVMAMEYAGFPIDLDERGSVAQYLADEQQRVRNTAAEIAGDEFDLNHLETKRWVLFGKGKRVGVAKDGDPVYEQRPRFGDSKSRYLRSQNHKIFSRTKANDLPQVTQAVLEDLAEKGDPMAAALLEWSSLEKLRGTFVDGLDKHLCYDNTFPTIHTSFKQHGTVTGRFTSSDPNIQQIPREQTDRRSIRALFVAGKGYVLIVADYDQIELRGAAFLAHEPRMIEVFRAGQDIHRRAASAMFQIDLGDVTSFQRSVGKTQNFGTLYGAGEDKIAAVAGVSKRRAAAFIRSYYEEFAGLEPWKAAELREARARGNRANPLVEPPFIWIPPNGRRRRLPDLYSMDDWKRWRAERQAINAVVQGFASNITKIAMRDLYQELRPYPAQMVAQVHDEIIVRVREDAASEVQDLVKRVMEGVVDPVGGGPILGEIPLVASASHGGSWAEAKQ